VGGTYLSGRWDIELQGWHWLVFVLGNGLVEVLGGKFGLLGPLFCKNSAPISQILVIFARVSSFLTAEEGLSDFDGFSNDWEPGVHIVADDSIMWGVLVGVWRVSKLFGCIWLEVVQFILVHNLLDVDVLLIFILVKCLLDWSHVGSVGSIWVMRISWPLLLRRWYLEDLSLFREHLLLSHLLLLLCRVMQIIFFGAGRAAPFVKLGHLLFSLLQAGFWGFSAVPLRGMGLRHVWVGLVALLEQSFGLFRNFCTALFLCGGLVLYHLNEVVRTLRFLI